MAEEGGLSSSPPALSADTLAILNSFMEEKKKREQEEARLQAESNLTTPDCFGEDWNLSQFWVCVLQFFLLVLVGIFFAVCGPYTCICSMPTPLRTMWRRSALSKFHLRAWSVACARPPFIVLCWYSF
jgi:hypothetical protein